MPDDHGLPVLMTNRELKDAIERTPSKTQDWHALISEAGKRTSFPRSWLPTAVSWPAGDSTGPSAW
jgi:hypothetical protein